MKVFLLFVAFMMAMPLDVISYSTGAPRCLFKPAGHLNANGKLPDFTKADQNAFTFEVEDMVASHNMVAVSVTAKQKYRGLLITTDFTTDSTTTSDNADLSDGAWMLSMKNIGLFRVANNDGADAGCGITHNNNQQKSGTHTFLFKPSNDNWRSKGFRVLIVSEPKEIFHQFHVNV